MNHAILQVALDLLDLDRALQVAREANEGEQNGLKPEHPSSRVRACRQYDPYGNIFRILLLLRI